MMGRGSQGLSGFVEISSGMSSSGKQGVCESTGKGGQTKWR